MAKQEKSEQDKSGYPPVQRQAEEQPAAETVPAEVAPAPKDSNDLAPGQVGSVTDSALAAASAQEEQSEYETTYVTTDATGATREVKTRRGYAAATLPWGDRAATDEEIAKYKAAQG